MTHFKRIKPNRPRRLASLGTPLCLAVLLCLATSCGQDTDTLQPSSEALLVGEAFLAGQNPASRAATDPVAIVAGDLYVGLRADNGYTAQTDVRFTYNTTDHRWDLGAGAGPVYLSDRDAGLYACYPAALKATPGSETVTLTAQTYAADKDLCFAIAPTQDVNRHRATAGFVLNHAYSQLRMSITHDASYTGAGVISAIELSATAGDLYQSSALALPTGVYTGTATQSSKATTNLTVPMNNTKECTLLIPPTGGTKLTGSKIKLTIDNRVFEQPLNYLLTELKAGTSYLLNLSIQTNQLVVTGVSLTDWDASGAIEDNSKLD